MTASYFHPAIVYVDESGDHGPISADYPIFVLAFCLFDKRSYAEDATTAVQQLKFKYFGHDAVVLHEREIRKALPPFQFLQQAPVREAFMADVGSLISKTQFTLIAAAVRKDALRERYPDPPDVYALAMKFGLERIAMHYRLREGGPVLHFVCESRGRREDDELELAFRRLRDSGNRAGSRLPCELVFAPKARAHAGTEIADLVARPIGRHLLKPEQPNRAWELLAPKFRRSPQGTLKGWGLKVFPS